METDTLQECLPIELRGPTTTMTRIAAGLSRAGVYRVEAGGRVVVLKVAPDEEPIAAWRCKLAIRRLAADAGLAPPVVHADEARRAIVSAFVVDRGFPMQYFNPATHDAALALLGRTLARVHDLPLPPDAPAPDARELLAMLASELAASVAQPAFVAAAVRRVLDEAPPPSERARVLSHNDVNPTNLLWDGERLLLLDWETAGANDPLYDLAAVSIFLRMDDATCIELVAAHDGAPVSALPPRFAYQRRLVATLAGALFLSLAHKLGHRGDASATVESSLSLGDVYQRLRTGAIGVDSADGRWALGLALVKAAVAL